MQNQYQVQQITNPRDKRNLYILLLTGVLSLIFILSLSTSFHRSFTSPDDPFLFPSRISLFLSPNLSVAPPRIAYFISGSEGDFGRILRLLLATYHPRNFYLLHLDLSAPQSDREALARELQSYPVFRAAKNVDVVGKANFAYQRGSSSISSLLHGASIILRLHPSWDWFINLSAEDYPLITQDDLLHIFSFLPKDLNFINHTSYIGRKESRRMKLIVVDPGLYLNEKSEMFYVTQKRDLPNSFRLYRGSTSAILSRQFVEFCLSGLDNFPRTLLMYLSNMPSSLSNYFPSILCNSEQFNHTIINHTLQYSVLSNRGVNSSLGSDDFRDMLDSGAAFATGFTSKDPVIDRIDRELLFRSPNSVVPGGWCLGEPGNDTCALWGSAEVLRPTAGVRRLEKLMVGLFSNGTSAHC